MAEPRLDAFLAFIERSRKRLVIAGIVALGLHVPLTPVFPLFRVLERLALIKREDPKREQPPVPQEVEVELRDLARQEQEKKAEEQKESKNALNLTPPAPPPARPASNVKFAQADNKPPPEEKPVETESSKAQAEKKKVKEAGLTGKLGNELAGKPAVSIGLWFTSFRDHPLGHSVSELLACDGQWNAFFRQGIDPLKDFDGALVVGPNVRDPTKMTAAVRHHMPRERVRSVMGALVDKSGDQGRWLRKDVVSVKVAKVGRVLFPHSEDTFFVTPPRGWEALHDVTEPLTVPAADGRSMSLVVRRPAASLARFGLNLPARLQELRLEVFANADQSIDVKLELEDTSEAAARADVRKVSEQLHDFFADLWATTEAMKTLTGLGALAGNRAESAPDLNLAADQKVLSGMVHFSPDQAKTTLDLISSLACKKPKAAPAPQASGAP
jgi:hypothetical protein